MLDGLANDLDHVTERLGALVHVMHDLREENATLRAALDRSAVENRQLKERVDDARLRVEQLIDRLPAES
jgi:uncharacterized protein (TIGR02449 family)